MFSGVLSTFGFSPSKSEKTPNNEAPSPGSTWAGSTPVDGDGSDPNSLPEYKVGASGLPEYEYPGVFVKNTFIDGPNRPPESLVDFMQPRQSQSCPTSALVAPPGLPNNPVPAIPEDLTAAVEANKKKQAAPPVTPVANASEAKAVTQPNFWPRTMSGDQLESLAAAAMMSTTPEKGETAKDGVAISGYTATPSPSPVKPMMWPRTMSGDALELTLVQESSPNEAMIDPSLVAPILPPPPTEWAPIVLQETPTLPPPMGYAGQADEGALVAPVLRLAEVIPEPELGSPEYPTLGSKAHRQGGCKPCAFLHTKGCQNGTDCEFCHLCEPGEKKKRQREKRHMQRMGVALR
jgi:hypothetical protein